MIRPILVSEKNFYIPINYIVTFNFNNEECEVLWFLNCVTNRWPYLFEEYIMKVLMSIPINKACGTLATKLNKS